MGLTNIGLVQNELPKGRIMIIFGGLLLILTLITLIIVIYTDRRLKLLNQEFVANCVKILEKEKIVTWTASFQHLLFDIIYPYNGKSGVGAVILTPNPYFEMCIKTTNDVSDYDVHVNDVKDKKGSKLKLPIPWMNERSISDQQIDEAQPLMKKSAPLILPPSDDNEHDDIKFVISCNEDSKTESDSFSSGHNELLPHSDAEEVENEQVSDKESKQSQK